MWKILKMLSGSSPIFALSNHITCSQTQTGATVPLKTIGQPLGTATVKQYRKAAGK
jgi:hypothetical protein